MERVKVRGMEVTNMESDTNLFWKSAAVELMKAREKFPSSNLSLAALMEEVGELAQAMLKVKAGEWQPVRIWEEALQVAAMAARVCLEGDPSFDVVEYQEPKHG